MALEAMIKRPENTTHISVSMAVQQTGTAFKERHREQDTEE